jgi:hypothetical protein
MSILMCLEKGRTFRDVRKRRLSVADIEAELSETPSGWASSQGATHSPVCAA